MSELKWNRTFALEQAGDDENLLQELVSLFQDTAADDLARIKEGAGRGHAGEMSDAAHSIKGAAASLGIEGVREAAAAVEKAGRSGDLEGAKRLLPGLEAVLLQFNALS